MTRFGLTVLWVMMLAFPVGTGARAGTDGLSLYVFGNSLVHHLSETDETTVPHWLALFSRAAGRDFAMDGQWGFVRDFVRDGPKPQWQFAEVAKAWAGQHRQFGDVGYDAVMLNPANFIQYQAADRPYDGDNPDGSSPLSATLQLIDQIAPGRLVIYEGWADMAPFTRSFPPGRRGMAKYLRHNAGAYHRWYEGYVAAVQQARPDLKVELLPVARVLSVLLDGGVLKGLAAKDLYIDKSPHGTATLYFLAGAITYIGLTKEPLPTMAIPDSVHPLVRDNFSDISETIHAEFGVSHMVSQMVVKAVESGPGLADPSLAMGLGEIADWSPQHPFIDRMKSARPWVGHLPGRWGGKAIGDLEQGGFLDEQGWVWGIPPDLKSVETFILTDQPEAAAGLRGRYRVTYDGQGELVITGRGREVRRKPGEIWFAYTPGPGPVGLDIRVTDPDRTGDYIRNIRVVHERHLLLDQAGALFNPDWLARVSDLRAVRFMDWMKTNGSDQAAWDNRPLPGDFSYGWRGVPVEVLLALGNEIGADIWVTLPHRAEDTYVRGFAQMVKNGLDPGLKVFAEYSNELWNFGFPQAVWAVEQAAQRWGKDAAPDAWMQFAGLRAAQVAAIWAEVFATESNRLVRVVGVHTGWKGLEQALLQAPLVPDVLPAKAFDAYAVTGYFGIELGTQDGAPRTLGWIKAAKIRARAEGMDKGFSRARLEQFVAKAHQRHAIAEATKVLREGSLKDLMTDLWPYHAQVAARHGLQLVMYEGGSHVVGVGPPMNNNTLTEFFVALNYSAEMGGLYQELLQGWKDAGGTLFNAYTDLGRPGKWGSWGALRYLEDHTPRHTALDGFNRANTGWWETRQGAFHHGRIVEGTDIGERMQGTGQRDIFLARGGDDVMLANGPGDRMHGGAGIDLVVLSGPRDGYEFVRDGGRVLARSKAQIVTMTEVEAVAFEGRTDGAVALEELF